MVEKLFDTLISFHIDSKLLNQLDNVSTKKGWKRSFTIREAIKTFLDNEKKEGKN